MMKCTFKILCPIQEILTHKGKHIMLMSGLYSFFEPLYLLKGSSSFKGNTRNTKKIQAALILKIFTCITIIGQAVLEIFHFKVDIPRTRISLVSIKCGEQ